MKAKFIKEDQNFEQGLDPKEAMGIGKGKSFMIICLDSTDDFRGLDNETAEGNLQEVIGPWSYEKAKKRYDELIGQISNVYLVEVLESEIYI